MSIRFIYNATLVVLILFISLGSLKGQVKKEQLETDAKPVSKELREQSVAKLQRVLDEGERWVKVHAAEYLILLEYRQMVKEEFNEELKRYRNEPKYRIGIWRVMSRYAVDEEEKAKWMQKIKEVAMNSDAPDQLHAMESLGKLNYQTDKQSEFFEQIAFDSTSRMGAYASWILTNSNHSRGMERLTQLIRSQNDTISATAAYILGNLSEIPPQALKALKTSLMKSSPEAYNYVFILGAVSQHVDEDKRDEYKNRLIRYLDQARTWGQFQICEVLAEIGTDEDLPVLESLLNSESLDVQAAAANAILRIDRRVIQGMNWIDWGVLALYFSGMLFVGWYYSRRTKTTEDYLLGGRSMKPWAVGLSLFATLFSALSYLSIPGEMIRFGPMALSMLVAFPIVIWVVGWHLIPFFMRLKVTSAYEILAVRFGESIRMLGSFFFLALRLGWMAVIIYATTSKVLIPLFGWDPSTIPYVSAVLGIITVIYTSMGGIKAVVFTDVVQSLILLFGAVFTISIISHQMGGVGAWFPDQWAPQWETPKFWFDTDSRMTFAMVVLSYLVWHISTAGSDQVAVQRYLSTKNVKSARRMFTTSILFNGLVIGLLGILGLALASFFRANPMFVPDGQTIVSDPDQLFPQFIASVLPVGTSGLLIAALVAAAMSSLSSGVNSACSVISADFFDRIKGVKSSEQGHVRRTKYISWIVGFVVVFLSLFASIVPGNLLAVAFKVANLLAAPLFVLFFHSMFVPWATTFGTWIAGILSVTAAVGIAYFNLFGLSFIWLMPVSLAVGIIVGLVASLLPIGPPAKPLLPKEN